MKEYSLEELKQHNGSGKNKAYISYDVLIYDVTGSFLWKSGKHQVSHYAGKDLTGELDRAPHGIEFLNRFPVIGYLNKS